MSELHSALSLFNLRPSGNEPRMNSLVLVDTGHSHANLRYSPAFFLGVIGNAPHLGLVTFVGSSHPAEPFPLTAIREMTPEDIASYKKKYRGHVLSRWYELF